MSTSEPTLGLWLHGSLMATLGPGSPEGGYGRLLMRWTGESAARWGVGARVLSHLLPVGEPGETVSAPRARAWLAGLLPEGNLREHMAFEAGVASDNVLGMLKAYGRDTAGAAIIAPIDWSATGEDDIGSYETVDDVDIARRLRRALAGYSADAFESTSLAGVQPKITLNSPDGIHWRRCLDGAPSTHIIKVGHDQATPLADIIDTECLCLALARELGLGQVEATIATFDDVRALVISRYDRVVAAHDRVVRLHQEDSAQALGLDTGDLNRKFQRGKALPSLAAIAAVLRAGGSEPDELLRLTTFNLAVGNSDAHAKNISLLRPQRGPAVLADAYDISMHGHHPQSSGLFAMDVNGRTRMADITAADLIAEGLGWGLPSRRAQRAVEETLARARDALRSIDHSAHPGVTPTAWATVESRVAGLLNT